MITIEQLKDIQGTYRSVEKSAIWILKRKKIQVEEQVIAMQVRVSWDDQKAAEVR